MTKKTKKLRADALLCEKGLANDHAHAASLILAGIVFSGTERIDKAGQMLSVEAPLHVKEALPFVSRGGLKLKSALDHFGFAVKDKIFLDIGASTGGFTDCLLKAGARKVYAIDVGYGQLDWSLQSDPRVCVMDRTNFRSLDIKVLPKDIDGCVADVSFISLNMIIPKITEIFSQSARNPFVVLLVKPQFEVEKSQVEAGGIVRDESLHQLSVKKISDALVKSGFYDCDFIPSPIKGRTGNQEFLLYAKFKSALLNS